MRRLVIKHQEFSTSNYKYGSQDDILNYTFEDCDFKQSNIYLFANNVKFINCTFSHGCKIIQRIPTIFEFINIKTNSYNQSLTIINDYSIFNNSNIKKIDIYSSKIEINNSEIENCLLHYKETLNVNDSNVIDTEIKNNNNNEPCFSNSYVNNKYYDLILNNVKQKKF